MTVKTKEVRAYVTQALLRLRDLEELMKVQRSLIAPDTILEEQIADMRAQYVSAVDAAQSRLTDTDVEL